MYKDGRFVIDIKNYTCSNIKIKYCDNIKNLDRYEGRNFIRVCLKTETVLHFENYTYTFKSNFLY